jgi:hypothetical protein
MVKTMTAIAAVVLLMQRCGEQSGRQEYRVLAREARVITEFLPGSSAPISSSSTGTRLDIADSIIHSKLRYTSAQ